MLRIRRWCSGVYNTCYGSGGGVLVFIIHVTDQEGCSGIYNICYGSGGGALVFIIHVTDQEVMIWCL
jgi:hypothetical protein